MDMNEIFLKIDEVFVEGNVKPKAEQFPCDKLEKLVQDVRGKAREYDYVLKAYQMYIGVMERPVKKKEMWYRLQGIKSDEEAMKNIKLLTEFLSKLEKEITDKSLQIEKLQKGNPPEPF